MPSAKISTEDLEKQIKERKKLIMRFVKFAESVIKKYGRLLALPRKVGRGPVQSSKILENFEGFTFLLDKGFTRMGGYSLRIWHHPTRDYCDITKDPDLGVMYEKNLDDEDVQVKFDEGLMCVQMLTALIEKKEKAAAEFERKEHNRKRKLREQEAENERRKVLENEAKKLGIRLTRSDFGDK